jgi:hypothetical protein
MTALDDTNICATDDQWYASLCGLKFIVTRVKRRVPLMKQVLLTLSGQPFELDSRWTLTVCLSNVWWVKMTWELNFSGELWLSILSYMAYPSGVHECIPVYCGIPSRSTWIHPRILWHTLQEYLNAFPCFVACPSGVHECIPVFCGIPSKSTW